MASEMSRILVIGATGYIGKQIVKASAKSGHPTLALVRDLSPADPSKAHLLQTFTSSGVALLQGDLNDHASLLSAVKQADVVISAVGFAQLYDQTKLIAAIKEAGNVKRFLPSEFGIDVDHTNAVEPVRSGFDVKVMIRRAVEAEGIPYTYLCCNFYAGYFVPGLGVAGATGLPTTGKVTILGDGNTEVVLVEEEDVAVFTVKAVEDPRTLNKAVQVRPKGNVLSHNGLVDLWEKKTGNKYERVYVAEEEVLKQIEEAPMPMNYMLAVCHAAFVKGDHVFDIDPAVGVEATELYPEVKYTTVDEYMNRLL